MKNILDALGLAIMIIGGSWFIVMLIATIGRITQ